MKSMLVMMSFLFSFNTLWGSESIELGSNTPEEATHKYLNALRDYNYEAYLDSLIPSALSLNEIASYDALLYWRDNLEKALALGYCGGFEVILDKTPSNEYGNPEAMAVLTTCQGDKLKSGVFLGFEDGKWWAVKFETYHPQF